MSKPQLQLVIFDMDGVLHDSEKFGAMALQQLLTQQGQVLELHDLEQRYGGMTFPAMQAQIEIDLGVKLGRNFADDCGELWLDLMSADLEPTPGIVAFLKHLQSRQILCCVASNSSAYQIDEALSFSGLEIFFDEDHRFSGEDQPEPKPAPDLHLHCLKRFSCRPDQALIFEDTPTGAQGGVAAGIPVCGYVGVHPNPVYQTQLLKNQGVRQVFDAWNQLPLELDTLIYD